MMGECSECRHWQQVPGQERIGRCDMLCTIRYETGDRLLLPGPPTGRVEAPIYTDMEFGCNQFEAKV